MTLMLRGAARCVSRRYFAFGAVLAVARVGSVVAETSQKQLSRAAGAAEKDRMGVKADEALREAAEPFEFLAENAFKEDFAKLDKTIRAAERAARSVTPRLAGGAVKELQAQLALLTAARQRQDRLELALAAVEGYRVLAFGVSENAAVPASVDLLDYAGFRFDANLRAEPVRWDAMAAAAQITQENWTKLAPRVTDAGLTEKVVGALDGMEQSVLRRDRGLAATSVKLALDLVDELERFFKHH